MLSGFQIYDLVATLHVSDFIHGVNITLIIKLVILLVVRDELLQILKQVSVTSSDSSGRQNEHSLLVRVSYFGFAEHLLRDAVVILLHFVQVSLGHCDKTDDQR